MPPVVRDGRFDSFFEKTAQKTPQKTRRPFLKKAKCIEKKQTRHLIHEASSLLHNVMFASKHPSSGCETESRAKQIGGIVMGAVLLWRKIGVKIPMRTASVDPKSTQLTPLTIIICFLE